MCERVRGMIGNKVRYLVQTDDSARAANADELNDHGGVAPSFPRSSKSKYSSLSGIRRSAERFSQGKEHPRIVTKLVWEEPNCRHESGLVLVESSLGEAVTGTASPTYSSDDGIDSNAVMSTRNRSSSAGIDGRELRSSESHESCWSSRRQAGFFLGVASATCEKSRVSAIAPCAESSTVLLTTSKNAEFNELDDGTHGGEGV